MAHWIGTHTPLGKGKVYTSFPAQTDYAEYISGTIYSDQEGKLEIQQAFLPVYASEGGENFEEDIKKWAEEGNWALAPGAIPPVEGTEEASKITVKAGERIAFKCFAVAPYWRLVYTNGGVDQKEFALEARAFERGRI